MELRVVLEPIFVRYGVNVVFSGHEHFYERITPQGHLLLHLGAAGRSDAATSSARAGAAFDQDQSFMLVEIAGADLFFRRFHGRQIVDSGTIRRVART